MLSVFYPTEFDSHFRSSGRCNSIYFWVPSYRSILFFVLRSKTHEVHNNMNVFHMTSTELYYLETINITLLHVILCLFIAINKHDSI